MRYTVPSTLVLYQYLVVFYVRYFSYFLFLAGVLLCTRIWYVSISFAYFD